MEKTVLIEPKVYTQVIDSIQIRLLNFRFDNDVCDVSISHYDENMMFIHACQITVPKTVCSSTQEIVDYIVNLLDYKVREIDEVVSSDLERLTEK